jgi:hypothetical protein
MTTVHSPYARMESGDPLRRKQTILSLIDMLSDLNNDSPFDNGSFSFPPVSVPRVLTDPFRVHLATGARRRLA